VPDPIHDYEQVSVYALDHAQREQLLRTRAGCSFNWATRDGWLMGVIMSYLWSAPKSSDVLRLERELVKRGLTPEKR